MPFLFSLVMFRWRVGTLFKSIKTMKKKRFLLLAFAALLSVGLASCEKDNDSTGGSNSNSNGGGSGQTPGDYVDLGLPSGLLWATRNIGAESPEDYGDYFAWGETQPKSVYNWSTYRYCNGAFDQLTKYCYNSSYGYNGFTDNLTTLQPSDDAATANWGNGWRTPTMEEWQELRDNTTSIWTTRNGVYGRLLTASNGNSLFLPAAGGRSGSELLGAGEDGDYWSASLYSDYPNGAWCFYFSSGDQFVDDGGGRRNGGQSVRAVRSAR